MQYVQIRSKYHEYKCSDIVFSLSCDFFLACHTLCGCVPLSMFMHVALDGRQRWDGYNHVPTGREMEGTSNVKEMDENWREIQVVVVVLVVFNVGALSMSSSELVQPANLPKDIKTC